MLALSPYAADLHNEHLRRRKRFAEASDRHIERSRPSQASLENSLRALSIPAIPPIDTPIDTQPKIQTFAREAPDTNGDTPAMLGKVCIKKIQLAVCAHYGVTRIDMISARRTADVVRPRQVAMYLAKTLTVRSLPEIGRMFGHKDHTTVLHAVRKIEALIARDATIGATINALEIAIS